MAGDLSECSGIGDTVPGKVGSLLVHDGFAPVIKPLAHGPGKR